jgi:hypothetical protein
MGSQDLIVLNTASAVHEQVALFNSMIFEPCISDSHLAVNSTNEEPSIPAVRQTTSDRN